MNNDFSPLVRSPKFFVRKEDGKRFYEDAENKCWTAEDGERVHAIASQVIGTQEACTSMFNYAIKIFKTGLSK